MFKKKNTEPTTLDAPDSIAPWELLDDADIATISARIKSHHPSENYTAFAKRIDNQIRACFDKGQDGTGKSIALIDVSNGEIVKRYPGFGAWFDDAVEESLKYS